MTCHDAALLLTAQLDGEATPGEVRQLDAHLRRCDACRRTAETMAVVCDAARSAAPEAPEVPHPASVRIAVVRRYAGPAIAAAAVLVMLLGPSRREAQREAAPDITLTPAAAGIPSLAGLDCRVGAPGPGCQIETPATFCSSARDCGIPF